MRKVDCCPVAARRPTFRTGVEKSICSSVNPTRSLRANPPDAVGQLVKKPSHDVVLCSCGPADEYVRPLNVNGGACCPKLGVNVSMFAVPEKPLNASGVTRPWRAVTVSTVLP